MATNLSAKNPKGRFSDRVSDYIKYRPSYPAEAIDWLIGAAGLQRESFIADVGSGTGIFSELFLKRGYRVAGVEPNKEMREAGEEILNDYPLFESLEGSAEKTPLAAESVDLISVATAFHWMDPDSTRKEFDRILKPTGKIVLLWNIRLENTPFLIAYNELINKYATDYTDVNMKNDSDQKISGFFREGRVTVQSFPNRQDLDFDSLKGRLLSSSYMPKEDNPAYMVMIDDLKTLFQEFVNSGHVSILYDTKMYLGA